VQVVFLRVAETAARKRGGEILGNASGGACAERARRLGYRNPTAEWQKPGRGARIRCESFTGVAGSGGAGDMIGLPTRLN
jgi:hypothetical protein